MARHLEFPAGMRNRDFATISSILFLAWACSPISPSVHKSTLRPSIPPMEPPKVESTDPRPSAQRSPIEARWIRTERGLNQELNDLGTGLVIKLSSSALEKLKTEGRLSVALPTEAEVDPPESVRVLLRVDMKSADLEKTLTQEPWSFEWDESQERTLVLRSTRAVTTTDSPQISESLVSVQIVLREWVDDEAFTSSP